MNFKFQERKCDVERDKRIASFRNRGFSDVAKDILAREKELSDIRHKLHDYVTDRINNDSSTETFTDCNKRQAYKIPFKYIDEADGTYQVFDGYICVLLVGENYANPRLNIGADYHTIRLDKSIDGSIDYWYDKTTPFLLWQAEHQDVMILRRACDELNELKKAYLDNIDYIIH